MAVEADGPLEHALSLRQRYVAGKHAELSRKASDVLTTEITEIVW